jgi:2-dehydro-3-deoxy-L-rhamnonate dehydrogenase (NAD+)
MGDKRRTDLTGHVIIVAGAASGIGAAAAIELAKQGARVACLDVDGVGAAATSAAITAGGGSAISAACDITSPSDVSESVGLVVDAWSSVEALVNSVGITGMTGAMSHEIPLEDFEHVANVNLRGAFILSQCVIPKMLAASYGRVLHISSVAGKEGNAGMVSYSASKAGLIGMVKSMGKEYAGSGVTVNALAPAVIGTPLLASIPKEQIDYMTDRIPMKRLGTLEEVADIIAWAVSPAASFTTGFTFDLTGGRATY